MLLDLLHHHHNRPQVIPGARPLRVNVAMLPKRKRRPRQKRQQDIIFLQQ